MLTEPSKMKFGTLECEGEVTGKKSGETIGVEVEESLEKISFLPTIEVYSAEPRLAATPRYFEFEDESGNLVKKENVDEAKSCLIPAAQNSDKISAWPGNPISWLAVKGVLLIVVFLLNHFIF